MDLNADLGEGGLQDEALMPYITSCSIACGGHTGTFESVETTLELALKYGVAVGAHPSYPDPQFFGRRSIKMNKNDLQKSIENQLQLFAVALNKSKGARWQHIKPHGALYNDMAQDRTLARAVLEVFSFFDIKGLFLPAKMPVVNLAREKGFLVWEEVFADRKYNDHGQLVSRKLPGAVLSKNSDVVSQVKQWKNGAVETDTGATFETRWDTLCLHSDTPNASSIAQDLAVHFKFKKLS